MVTYQCWAVFFISLPDFRRFHGGVDSSGQTSLYIYIQTRLSSTTVCPRLLDLDVQWLKFAERIQ